MEPLYESNLRDYWNIFVKRKWEVLIAFLVVFVSILIYTSLQVPLYRASVLLKIEPWRSLPSEVIFPTPVRYWEQDFEVSDYAKQIVSAPILETAARELGWITDGMDKQERERIISDIGSKISAAEIEKSNMIRLSAQFSNAQRATDISNQISQVFKRVNAEQKNARTHNVRIFIEQTLDDVSAKLQAQEDRLKYLTTHGAVGVGVNMVQQIAGAEKKLVELRSKFTDQHPDVINLQDEVNRLKAELNTLPKEEFEYGILKRDIAINETLYSSLKKQLQEAQIKEAEKIDNVLIVNPALVPKHPFYPNKMRNYLVGMVLGVILGVFVALVTEHLDTSIGRVDDIESFIKVSVVGVIPFCSEQYKGENKKKKGPAFFRFKRDILKQEAWKPIRILEFEKSESNSLFLEAFRLLAVNLQVLFGKGGRIKNQIIMITSCKPEEGKTLIASTLSVIMAQMGYRVLVVDSDVRRAHVHKSFGLKDKENGLIEVLTGKITLDKAVKTATDIILGANNVDSIIEKPWLNNLNILTAGATFPNTINLFNSSKLDEILEDVRSKYDIIFIDSSPILAVSEPSILIPKVDGVLLVYRAGFASRLMLRRAKIQIESIRGKGSIAGVILNNVTPEIGMDTYYYYNKRYYGKEKSADGSAEGGAEYV